MTAEPGERAAPALLVIDMQSALVALAHRASATVAAIAGLRARARAAGVPVVFAQQRDEELEPGTEGWRIVPELAPAAADTVVPKAAPDSFLGTEPDAVLRARGVTEVVVTGSATEICVESTARQALSRGYDVVLVADGHTTSVRPAASARTPRRRHSSRTTTRSTATSASRAAGCASCRRPRRTSAAAPGTVTRR